VLLQLLICFYVVRGMRSEQDYLLAGRKLGVPLVSMTIFATWFGAESCIGAAGLIYDEGLAGGRIDPFGYALCIIFLGLFFARKLWARKLTTLGDFFRQRFGSGVEKIAVLLLIPPSVLWAAAQILAFGQVLSASSSLAVDASIAFAASIVIAYTVLGGMMADVVSDFIQGGVLIVGLVILLVLVLVDIPDIGAVADSLSVSRLSFRSEGESWLSVLNGWSIPLIGSLFASELITRMLSSRSAEVARRSAMIGGCIYLSVGLIPAFLGLIGPSVLPGLQDPEQLLPLLAQQYLPTVLYIVFVGAIVSAILSTVDSALLAAGGLMSHNLVLRYIPSMNERQKVLISRSSVCGFGIIAYLLAISAESVMSLIQESSALGSTGIFTCCLMGLTQKRGGKYTALATLLVGIVSYATLAYLLQFDYAYITSLAMAFGTFAVLMWFEPIVEELPLGEHSEAM
jgi:SSS family transporter